jgi:hypothetical protein
MSPIFPKPRYFPDFPIVADRTFANFFHLVGLVIKLNAQL